MALTVNFKNVGRDKASFAATVGELEHTELLKAVRPYLGSRDIEFVSDPPWHDTGRIVVGGFRTVGSFTIDGQVVPQ